MNTLTVAEVVNLIYEAIGSIEDKGKYPSVLHRIETIFSILRLKQILADLKTSKNSQLPADRNTIIRILVEFKYRYTIVSGTTASYEIATDSYCTKLYCAVGKVMQGVIGCSLYDLLMPDVENVESASKLYKTSKGTLSDLKLHEFVFSDDGTPIEIKKALDNYRLDASEMRKTNPHKLAYKIYHTCKGENEKIPLSEAERDRVIKHSDQAYQYYISILTNKDVEAKEKELQDAINGDNYVVNTNYGDIGEKKLNSGVGENIRQLIKSQEQLVDIMKNLPRNEWKNFLEIIDTQDLLKIMLEKKPFIDAVRNRQIYKEEDMEYNRALCYCFAEAYIRDRNDKPQFKSFIGSFGKWSSYVGGYSKEQKIEAVIKLQEYLASGQDLKLFKVNMGKNNKGQDVNYLNILLQKNMGGYDSETAVLANQVILVGHASYYMDNDIPMPVAALPKARM